LPLIKVPPLRLDRFTSSIVVHLLAQSITRWWLEISLIAFVLNSYKWWQVPWVRGSGCLQTSLFHPTKCDVLWPNITFHSFPNMELEWSLMFNESCKSENFRIIKVLLASCTTSNKGIFKYYIWKQLIHLKYLYVMRADSLTFCETHIMNLKLFSFLQMYWPLGIGFCFCRLA